MALDLFINDNNANNNIQILTNPFIRRIFYGFIEVPLMELYFKGPWLYGYGFWSGKSSTRICAELTDVPEDHWIQNVNTCTNLIERHFEAFIVFIYFILYVLIFIMVLFKCLHK